MCEVIHIIETAMSRGCREFSAPPAQGELNSYKQGKTVSLICLLLVHLVGMNGILQMLFKYHLLANALAIAAILAISDVVLIIMFLIFKSRKSK